MKIKTNFIISLVYLSIVLVFRKNSLWAVNDDFVLSQIINNQSDLNNSVVSFMSYFLGFTLAILFKLTGFDYWLGVFLALSNLIFILMILNAVSKYHHFLIKYLSYLSLMIVIPFLILNPTYTVTSILVTFAGLFYLLILIYQDEKNEFKFFLAGFIFSIGIAIRLDSYKGSLVFLGIYFLIFLVVIKPKKIFSKLFIFILPFLIILLSQFIIQTKIINSNVVTKKYLSFQQLRHELFYTPAILKMHQKVISGDLLPDQWGNVEMILLRNWIYPDQEIYNSSTFLIGKKSVEEFIGVKGVINSDIKTTFNTSIAYLNDIEFYLYFTLFILLFTFVLSKKTKILTLLNFSLISGYFISLYYAAAVLRFPIRVSLPYFLILILLLLFNLNISQIKFEIKSKFKLPLILILISFTIIFNINSEFGFKKIFENNSKKISFSTVRDKELLKFNPKAIYISTISFSPSSNSGPFLQNYSTLNNSLLLDWSTFSPSWRMKANSLSLNPDNVYMNIAKTKNVFFISNSELASLADMYMNDHEILRGKKCLLKELTGEDGAGIYTYQASADFC
jgi:hypothetical protein